MPLDLTVPPAFRHFLRFGTSTWKHDSWKGLIYDRDKRYRPDDYLADYARSLGSVEVDQWFWSLFPVGTRLPDPKTVGAYAGSVPDEFVFTVKAPNALTLTHYYEKQPSRHESLAGKPNPGFLSPDLLRRFLAALVPLGKKLGPVMFQFEYLNKRKMASPEAFFEQFGDFISKAPEGMDYAVEIRNPNYLTPAYFKFLERHGLGFVYFEGDFMPPIGEIFDRFKPATAPFQILRLHGADRPGITEKTGGVWDRILAPKPASLKAAAAIIRSNRRRRVLIYANLSNYFEGSAPRSIRRLIDVLSQGVRGRTKTNRTK